MILGIKNHGFGPRVRQWPLNLHRCVHLLAHASHAGTCGPSKSSGGFRAMTHRISFLESFVIPRSGRRRTKYQRSFRKCRVSKRSGGSKRLIEAPRSSKSSKTPLDLWLVSRLNLRKSLCCFDNFQTKLLDNSIITYEQLIIDSLKDHKQRSIFC